jgi:hypothetical protein
MKYFSFLLMFLLMLLPIYASAQQLEVEQGSGTQVEEPTDPKEEGSGSVPPNPPVQVYQPAIRSSSSGCPSGQHYVRGYTRSNGTRVSGYCRR